jgi:hypothetical protein
MNLFTVISTKIRLQLRNVSITVHIIMNDIDDDFQNQFWCQNAQEFGTNMHR